MLLVLSINRSNNISIFNDIPIRKLEYNLKKQVQATARLRVIVKPRGIEFSQLVNLS